MVLNTRRIAAFSPRCATAITSFTPRRPRLARLLRKLAPAVSASEGPMSSPTISRFLSGLTKAIIAATETIRPPSRCFR